MMTDKQLQALMSWSVAAARAEIASESRYGQPADAYMKAKKLRAEMYGTFGFVEGPDGYPITPQHPNTLPPAICSNCGQPMSANHVCTAGDIANFHGEAICKSCGELFKLGDKHKCYGLLATSDPEGHRQAIAARWAIDNAKNVAIADLLLERKACNDSYPSKAADIMRLWLELKAIMEPGNA